MQKRLNSIANWSYIFLALTHKFQVMVWYSIVENLSLYVAQIKHTCIPRLRQVTIVCNVQDMAVGMLLCLQNFNDYKWIKSLVIIEINTERPYFDAYS